ncbi:MAG: efflux RND transporter periplasmic adaptor subunit [Spirochaetales bacterium]|nr:efflux RND transporter periplasmic adaptor subunit [Spirochaetales bacterium]
MKFQWNKKTGNRIILAGAAVIIISLISIPVLRKVFEPEPVKEEILTPVVVSKPEIGSISRTLYYSGTLEPNASIIITSKVAGRIEDIFVKKGDLVTKDMPLIRIEDNAVSLQREQAFAMWQAADAQLAKAKKGLRQEQLEIARASLNQAEDALRYAQDNFDRIERLYKSGTIAKADYEEAENKLNAAKTDMENARRNLKIMEEGATREEIEMARSQAEAARAQYQLARLQVENTRLGAPVVGMVADVLADKGNMVGTSTPILAIVQIDPIIANIPIPEKYYGEVMKNRDDIFVRIFPNAYPDTPPFSGILSNVDPIIDAVSRTFKIEIEIRNNYRLLRPGMYVNVELVVETRTNVIIVPPTAIVKRGDRKIIYLVKEGNSTHAAAAEVATGIVNENAVQVISGVDEKSTIIVEGNLYLEDNQKVRILK